MDLRCFNPQFFIGSKVGDVALEKDDARAATGPDQPLRVVIDAVRVLCAALPADGLLPGDRLALARLEELGQRVDAEATADDAADAVLTSALVDNLIRRLQLLRRDDPRAADEVLGRITAEAGPPAARAVTG